MAPTLLYRTHSSTIILLVNKGAFPKLFLSSAAAAAILGLFCAGMLTLPGRGQSSPHDISTDAGKRLESPPREHLAEVLERLDRLEAGMAALREELRSRLPAPPAVEAAPAADPIAERPVSAPPKGKGGPAAPGRKLLGSTADLERPEGLRTFIEEVIRDEREERLRAEERRVEEEKAEWKDLGEGPYGKLNLRVNVLSRRLGLDDRQTHRYFEVLTDYSARLEEAGRGLDKLNPESLRTYEGRKKEIQVEFEAAVLEGLTPDQARQFQGLPEFARSPGQSNTKEMALLWAKRG